MSLPTPEDLGRAPVWENYVIAQTAAASRGQIPEHALAVGVEVDGPRLRLRFQLSQVTEKDESDMSDIVSELEGLVGDDVVVESSFQVTAAVTRNKATVAADAARQRISSAVASLKQRVSGPGCSFAGSTERADGGRHRQSDRPGRSRP
ncbi:hypothetical protein [Promicromonospora sp. NPDC057488]|uniref:hypothetical protein n=1 Tax=Promicromonospora sp. NPDC057488 TaxID=3346147 RepID=UPI0036702734